MPADRTRVALIFGGQSTEHQISCLTAAGVAKAIDTDRYFVVCVNVLGGCQGTTGPSSIDPRTGKHYELGFPLLDMADFVTVHRQLLAHLGIERLLRDGKAGWVMGPTNEVLRQFVGKAALLGFEVLDYWNQAVNQRVLNNELKKMSKEEKAAFASKLLADAQA